MFYMVECLVFISNETFSKNEYGPFFQSSNHTIRNNAHTPHLKSK